ncbi:hypothetical protein FYJ53_10315 [Eubacterium sp. BL-380-WT-2B]|uniref:hypothetical protein n=1 Tax=Eubacterium sp. BL-380-WT-2B TaxID=2605785 RepID=UPI0012B20FC8|nr:hypothetical protein [Eubacterium sp. BL-380-WT-2B]MSS94158.1 hypothetical protein [Eubacterium sp. BL-380-WT-2B]
MNIRISKNIFFKVIALLLCIYIGFAPFFQPKKVQASPFLLGITALLTTGMIAGRYVQTNVLYTPEQMNRINEQWTANLQTAFPDPDDYNHQMNALQNLNQKLLNGEEVNWSKYSGKALYAVLKGVVDVVWPTIPEDESQGRTLLGTYGDNRLYVTLNPETTEGMWPTIKIPYFPLTGWYFEDYGSYKNCVVNNVIAKDGKRYAGFYVDIVGSSNYRINRPGSFGFSFFVSPFPDWSVGLDNDLILTKFLGLATGDQTSIYRPDFKNKLPDKVKLPTRLPQTVINNITNYVDNSTENLIIAPTPDELPQLPEDYNPVTDDLPDLPGYQDVVPDQEPTTDPEPTPTPPEPTPTPPEYDGSGWVNPIGNFLAGLLEFLKTAFVPTQSLDFSPLQNMESGTFGAKFPFSLPSDFGKILGVIQADPITPKFDVSIPLSKVGYQDIPMEIDLEPYSNIAGICKSGFVILFCIGLFFLTRRFMSPGG